MPSCSAAALFAAVGCEAALPHGIFATGVEPPASQQIDPAPCLAAIMANDDDKIVAACGGLIDSEKAEKTDRIKALIARAGVYQRKDMIDRAIDDYSVALRLDPTQADIFNARGELWRKKGDRPKAIQDFGAAIRLNPNHAAAKARRITNRWRWSLSASGRCWPLTTSPASIARTPGAQLKR